MKLRTSPYKTPSKAARLALALAAARAIVILHQTGTAIGFDKVAAP